MPTEICRYIRANGTRCGSPALREQPLCYFHTRDQQRRRALDPEPEPAVLHPMQLDRDAMQRDPLLVQYFSQSTGPVELDFPALEDRESIQVALSMLLSALGRNRLDTKRAGMMLYGLQVASANAKTLTSSPATVRDTVTDETGRELAPDEDPEDTKRKSYAEELLDSIRWD
jgi:hypothetical protein